MKLFITSIILFISIMWSIAFTSCEFTSIDNNRQTVKEATSNSSNVYAAKKDQWTYLAEELLENEEEINNEFFPLLIIKVLFPQADDKVEYSLFEIENKKLPVLSRLFILFGSIKIPLFS